MGKRVMLTAAVSLAFGISLGPAHAVDFSKTSPESATVLISPGNPSIFGPFTYRLGLSVESEAFCLFPWSCGGGPSATLQAQDGVGWTQDASLANAGGSFNLNANPNTYTTPNIANVAGGVVNGAIRGTFVGLGSESDDTVIGTMNLRVNEPPPPPPPPPNANQVADRRTPPISGNSFGGSGTTVNVTIVNPFNDFLVVLGESLAFPTGSLIDDPFSDLLSNGITLPPDSFLGRSLSFAFPASGDQDICFMAYGLLDNGSPNGLAVHTPDACLSADLVSATTAVFTTPEPSSAVLLLSGAAVVAGALRLKHRAARG